MQAFRGLEAAGGEDVDGNKGTDPDLGQLALGSSTGVLTSRINSNHQVILQLMGFSIGLILVEESHPRRRTVKEPPGASRS